MATKIFVSYRREDSAGNALGISQYLENEFGQKNVFIDVDMRAGARFPEVLEERLSACKVLLALIGAGWLDARDDKGQRRLDSPEDWVRLEVARALKRGITVNPGVIKGGTRSNVTAAEASAEIDIRAPRFVDARILERKFRSLRPFDRRCSIEIRGGLNRPPMERSKGAVELFTLARRLGGDLGIDLEESSTGGGSDGNFTAALGIPTLDGLGAVGEGAHAAHESVLIDRLPDRVALLAKLTAAIS